MKDERGFTLIELLVVIAILAVLFGVTALALNGIGSNAETETMAAELDVVQTAVDVYMAENNTDTVTAETTGHDRWSCDCRVWELSAPRLQVLLHLDWLQGCGHSELPVHRADFGKQGRVEVGRVSNPPFSILDVQLLPVHFLAQDAQLFGRRRLADCPPRRA